ncbi:FkbM family methyltransferase, partial [Novosphingobium sp.]|uniref:FkbM family methyltransferase n=1 Tax=Novosphingobium sp. TaxID=1874826 RepID=UPI0035619DF5
MKNLVFLIIQIGPCNKRIYYVQGVAMQLKSQLKRELRDFQTLFPFIRTAKFSTYNLGAEFAGLFVEPEFKVLSRLGPTKLVVDIGGNWGQSVVALRKYAKPQKIVTFEPNPELACRLRHSFKNDNSIYVEQFALGEVEGDFDLYVPKYRNFIYDGLASLSHQEATQWLGPNTLSRFDKNKLSTSAHKINVKRLDDYHFTPDVIKIDVQGLEDSVARGGCETINKHKPVLIVEAPSDDFVEMMAEFK